MFKSHSTKIEDLLRLESIEKIIGKFLMKSWLRLKPFHRLIGKWSPRRHLRADGLLTPRYLIYLRIVPDKLHFAGSKTCIVTVVPKSARKGGGIFRWRHHSIAVPLLAPPADSCVTSSSDQEASLIFTGIRRMRVVTVFVVQSALPNSLKQRIKPCGK